MSREEYIKKCIADKGYNTKEFASLIKMPYTTLLSILNKSVGGASLDNIVKICHGLEIDLDVLNPYQSNNFTEFEKRLISEYRKHPEMQPAINKMLDIQDMDNTPSISTEIADDITKILNMPTPINTE